MAGLCQRRLDKITAVGTANLDDDAPRRTALLPRGRAARRRGAYRRMATHGSSCRISMHMDVRSSCAIRRTCCSAAGSITATISRPTWPRWPPTRRRMTAPCQGTFVEREGRRTAVNDGAGVRYGCTCLTFPAASPRAMPPFAIRPPFGSGSKPWRAAWVRRRDAPAASRACRWLSLPPWPGTSKRNRSGPTDSPTTWVPAPRRC